MKKQGLQPDFAERLDFEPKIGRHIFEKSGRSLLRYLSTGTSTRRSRQKRTNQRWNARGVKRTQASLQQLVTVKARVAKIKPGKGVKALKAHVRYLERSGTGIDAERATFFGSDQSLSDKEVRELIGNWDKDKHHFRFIVSPENGAKLDLESYGCALMEGVERDLKTKLEWFAAAHYNTENPHLHVVVRGKDERRADLFIDKDYIKSGMRSLAQELATDILGHRTEQDVRRSIEKNIVAYRFTPLDKVFLREASTKKGVYVVEPFKKGLSEVATRYRADKLARLNHLKSMELAKEVAPGKWQLADDLEKVLREMGLQNDIVKQIHERLKGTNYSQEIVTHKNDTSFPYPLVGEVADRVVIDELSDKVALLVKGEDGKTHHLPLSRFSEIEGFEAPPGAFVSLNLPKFYTRADEVIERFSGENGGIFNAKSFREHVQAKSLEGHWKIPSDLSFDQYAERFVSRIETLSRLGIVKKERQDEWVVPLDLTAKVEEFEKKLPKREKHFQVEVLSCLSLDKQVSYRGKTWLDSKIERSFFNTEPQSFLIMQSMERRKDFLREEKIDLEPGYSKQLYKDELGRVHKSLSAYGAPIDLRSSHSFTGKVLRYELFGTGHHLVALGKDGYTVIKVNRGHKRLEQETEVMLSIERKTGSIKIEPVRERQRSFNRER